MWRSGESARGGDLLRERKRAGGGCAGGGRGGGEPGGDRRAGGAGGGVGGVVRDSTTSDTRPFARQASPSVSAMKAEIAERSGRWDRLLGAAAGGGGGQAQRGQEHADESAGGAGGVAGGRAEPGTTRGLGGAGGGADGSRGPRLGAGVAVRWIDTPGLREVDRAFGRGAGGGDCAAGDGVGGGDRGDAGRRRRRGPMRRTCLGSRTSGS